MKTKVLFAILFYVIYLDITLGQTTYNWGNWTANECFRGISTRAKIENYSSSTGKYNWSIEIKNNYNVKVTLNIGNGDDAQPNVHGLLDIRATLLPGEVFKTYHYDPSNIRVTTKFNQVCFHYKAYTHGQSDYDNCSEEDKKGYASYADCDNGTPNYRLFDGSTNNSGSSQNQQNTLQNNTYQPQQYQQPQQNNTYQQQQTQQQQKYQQQQQSIQQFSNSLTDLATSIQQIREAKKEKEAEETRQRVQFIDANMQNFLDMTSTDNDELGYFTDFFMDKLERAGYQLVRGKYKDIRSAGNVLITVRRDDSKKFSKKSFFASIHNGTDTLSIVTTFHFHYSNPSSEYSGFMKDVSIISHTNGIKPPMNIGQLKKLVQDLFSHIYYDLEVFPGYSINSVSFKTKHTSTQAKLYTSSVDFSNRAYRGSAIEFAEALALDTSHTVLAYRNNASKYRSGLTGNEEYDWRSVLDWYAKAAELGDTLSIYGMASLYTLLKDYSNAMKRYSLLVEWNHPVYSTDAMLDIGNMYKYGNGVPKNCNETVYWYRKAAEISEDKSQAYLRLIHIYGGLFNCSANAELEKYYMRKYCELRPYGFECDQLKRKKK